MTILEFLATWDFTLSANEWTIILGILIAGIIVALLK